MLYYLVLKDIKAYKGLFLFSILLPMNVLISLVNIHYYEFGGNIMTMCMIIAVAASAFLFTEKSRNTEILTCSLPVSRTSVVVARYITSVLITVIGFFMFYGNVFVSEYIYTEPVTRFAQINTLRVLVMASFFMIVQTSVFLPSVFRFRLLGTIIAFILSIVLAVFATYHCFRPYTNSIGPHFSSGDVTAIPFLLLLLFFILSVSVLLSVEFYSRKEL